MSVIFAMVKSITEPLGQAATQASQPIQAASPQARSASAFGTRVACALGFALVRAVIYPLT